jgi:hypothetical protein
MWISATRLVSHRLLVSGFCVSSLPRRPSCRFETQRRPFSQTLKLWKNEEHLRKWGSKNKVSKRRVPLALTVDMALTADQEALLAPFRAKVKEQVSR